MSQNTSKDKPWYSMFDPRESLGKLVLAVVALLVVPNAGSRILEKVVPNNTVVLQKLASIEERLVSVENEQAKVRMELERK